MPINHSLTMTADDAREQRKEALFALEEANQQLGRLVQKAKIETKKLYKVAELLGKLETFTDDPYRSESPLLALPLSEYQGVANMVKIRELAVSIAAARHEVNKAVEAKRKVGLF